MSRLPRAQFSVLALMAAMGGGTVVVHAATLPPFVVSPDLLGAPPTRQLRPDAAGSTAAPATGSLTEPSAQPAASPAAADTQRKSAVSGPAAAGVLVGGTVLQPVPLGTAKDRKKSPVYVTADQIDGTPEDKVIATGNVDLVKADSELKADVLTYSKPDDEVEATGHVYLRRERDEVAGPHLKLKIGESVGSFEEPAFQVNPKPSPIKDAIVGQPRPGYGTAEKLEFQGEDRYRLEKATYSTCKPGDGQDWFAKVSDLDLNYVTSEGEAHNATVVFKGVPILYSPWLSFSLNGNRKSGLLAPTWGTTTNSGMEFALPYYWNIAPNMDATITPRFMARRGTQLRGEYRYLGETYNGVANGEYLPHDQLTNTSRRGFSWVHNQSFSPALTGRLNVNQVSDNTYFTDLSSQISTIAQTNLVREGRLTYAGGWWTAGTLVQRFQTLQDPNAAPVAKPYERLPQMNLTANRYDLPAGTAFHFNGEFVAFNHPDGNQVQGQRTTFYPQLSLPLQTAAFYVTPKVGVHNTQYQLEQQGAGVPSSMSRSVPIVSVDSGVTFERDTNFFGRDLVQTLEPRLYYLNVPYRDQSQIPVFDSGVADFNFAQIFSENAFTGGDRIADANQTTAALSSRLISPTSGAELARLAVGQRWYFRDQLVTLPGVTPRTGHLADYLAAFSAKLSQTTSFDSGVQYNPRDKHLQRFNAGVRYQPETGHIFNASYRFNRDQTLLTTTASGTTTTTTATDMGLRQIDLSGQWPVAPGWSAVGRYNYSIKDKRLVENVLGMEYDEACWALRFVLQKVATTTGQTSSAFFVQLQLNGFSSLGANPISLLKRNVPGFGRVVETENEEMIPK
ncbi:MAG TPA: LPS-assembly protein LptD [Rhodocyclaceae bacterium]|nr:LPS-assembly protein LptD [Rhodocyclaceae bacterium]